jgi:WD40 repeat protein
MFSACLTIAILAQTEPGFSTPLQVSVSSTGSQVVYKSKDLYFVNKDEKAPRKLDGGHGAGLFTFTNDESKIVACMAGGGFAIWDAKTGTQEVRVRTGTAAFGIAVSIKGDRVAFGSKDRRIEIYDVPTKRMICSTDVDAETKQLFSANRQELPSGEITTRTDFQYTVNALAFSPDGRFLASQGMGGTFIRIWNANDGKLIHEIRHRNVAKLSWSPDGSFLYDLKGVRAWKSTDAEVEFFNAIGSNVFGPATSLGPSMVVTPNGHVGALTYNGTVYLLEHGMIEPTSKVQLEDWNGADTGGLSANAQFVAAIDQAKTRLQVWDAVTGMVRWKFDLPTD